jgi:hypothetical protein
MFAVKFGKFFIVAPLLLLFWLGFWSIGDLMQAVPIIVLYSQIYVIYRFFTYNIT